MEAGPGARWKANGQPRPRRYIKIGLTVDSPGCTTRTEGGGCRGRGGGGRQTVKTGSLSPLRLSALFEPPPGHNKDKPLISDSIIISPLVARCRGPPLSPPPLPPPIGVDRGSKVDHRFERFLQTPRPTRRAFPYLVWIELLVSSTSKWGPGSSRNSRGYFIRLVFKTVVEGEGERAGAISRVNNALKGFVGIF